VDRTGAILEVANNSEHVVSHYHTSKVYFSRLKLSPAAQALEAAKEPIDFHAFRNAARDKSICFGSSISGMTVEIDPKHPELLTCAWVALPARTVAFPLLMGQDATPVPVADGSVYARAKIGPARGPEWEALERRAHSGKTELAKDVLAGVEAGNPEEAQRELLNQWSAKQAGVMFGALTEAPAAGE
jgi:hypothetical protein